MRVLPEPPAVALEGLLPRDLRGRGGGLLVEQQRHDPEEVRETELRCLLDKAEVSEQPLQPGSVDLGAEALAQALELLRPDGALALGGLEGVLQRVDLLLREEPLRGRRPRPEAPAACACSRLSGLDNLRRPGQLHLRERSGNRHHHRLIRVRAGLREDARLRQVVGPLADEDLAALGVEVGPWAFALVVEPASFVGVAAGLGEGALARAKSVVPLADVEVAVGVPHRAVAVHPPGLPGALVELPGLEEAGAPPVPPVVLPGPHVQLAQLAGPAGRHPEGPLAVALAHAPLALVLLAAGEHLHSIAGLLVVGPLAVVAGTCSTGPRTSGRWGTPALHSRSSRRWPTRRGSWHMLHWPSYFWPLGNTCTP